MTEAGLLYQKDAVLRDKLEGTSVEKALKTRVYNYLKGIEFYDSEGFQTTNIQL
jgi:hypothetical protein